MMKAAALELIWRGRTDREEAEGYCADAGKFLKLLDSIGVERAGLINYVSPKIIGFTPEVNDWIARYCSAAPKRLLAFGGVHPSAVANPAAEVDRMAKLGIRAIKIHPSHQAISPNGYVHGDSGLGAVYERARANGLPVMIHTGTSIFPGARNLHAQPLLCDDLGVDYPDLTVILAHGGRPLWMEEAFFLVRRHENMHMDISESAQKLLEYFRASKTSNDKSLVGHGLAKPRRSRNPGQHREVQRAADPRRRKAKDSVRKRRPTIPRLADCLPEALSRYYGW